MTYSSLSASQNSFLASRSSTRNVSKAPGGRFVGRGQNAVDFRRGDGRLGPVTNTVILIVLACLLGLLYLTQVTKTDAYGYSIDKLQSQQAELKHDHDDLVLASAQMQSLDRVQNSAQATAMVQTAPSATVR